jgi:hypothetical protein
MVLLRVPIRIKTATTDAPSDHPRKPRGAFLAAEYDQPRPKGKRLSQHAMNPRYRLLASPFRMAMQAV